MFIFSEEARLARFKHRFSYFVGSEMIRLRIVRKFLTTVGDGDLSPPSILRTVQMLALNPYKDYVRVWELVEENLALCEKQYRRHDILRAAAAEERLLAIVRVFTVTDERLETLIEYLVESPRLSAYAAYRLVRRLANLAHERSLAGLFPEEIATFRKRLLRTRCPDTLELAADMRAEEMEKRTKLGTTAA